MDYVKIPQNVKVEDKLIGPLSLRQIGMIAAGGGLSYTLYAAVSKTYGSVPALMHAIIWWPAIFAAAFAMVRINDISLFRYCLLIIETMSKPRQRVWQPRRGIMVVQTSTVSTKKKKKKKEDVQEEEVPEPKSDVRLEELSVILDRGVSKEQSQPTPTS